MARRRRRRATPLVRWFFWMMFFRSLSSLVMFIFRSFWILSVFIFSAVRALFRGVNERAIARATKRKALPFLITCKSCKVEFIGSDICPNCKTKNSTANMVDTVNDFYLTIAQSPALLFVLAVSIGAIILFVIRN